MKNTPLHKRITRPQLERALMIVTPPKNVATTQSKRIAMKNMDMACLLNERIQMHRLGFYDTVALIDDELEERRVKIKKEQQEYEDKLTNVRLQALNMLNTKREHERLERLREDENLLYITHQNDLDSLIEKQEKEYNSFIETISLRATGGVEIRNDNDELHYLSRKNRFSSFNTRRQTKDVIKLKTNALRLHKLGRDAEANEMYVKAANLDEISEQKWRKNIIKNAAGINLSMLIDKQSRELDECENKYLAKLYQLRKKYRTRKITQTRIETAEKAKVIKNIKQLVKQKFTVTPKKNTHKNNSNFFHDNISFQSRNHGDCYDSNIKDDEYSWKAPSESGLNNSNVLFDQQRKSIDKS
tara:strand:- start:1126 stop:2199 length:1074 start_codon:yes stop_codon:yes gene_type:complete